MTQLTRERLLEIAASLILAVLRSASTDRIRPKDWWTRAQTALESAGVGSESLDQMFSLLCRRLQVEVPTEETARALISIEDRLRSLDEASFEDLARIAAERAPYVIVRARVQRDQERERAS